MGELSRIEVADMADELLQRLRGTKVDPDPDAMERWKREEDERTAAWRAEVKLKAEEDAIDRILPPRMAAIARLGSETPAVVAVNNWFDVPSRGLMIRGGIGVGKSGAAAHAVARMIRLGKPSISWLRPNQFVSAVLHSYDENSPKLGEHMVVIDDLGRETKADFVEALCAFIDDVDTRFILTTNLQKEEFRAHYDARLVDRLNECAKAVSIKGDSMRRKDGGF